MGANLSQADLRYAKMDGANLFEADLSYANLSYANLSNANLTGANLTEANLSFVDLRGANLTGADLTNDLTDFSLQEEAKLKNANIMDAVFCNTKTPWGIDNSGC